MAARATPVRTRRQAWALVASAVGAQVTISVAEMGVPTLTPYLKDSFDLSLAGVGLLVASINLGRVVGSIPAGRAVDRVGESTVMIAGGLGVAVFFALGALAPTAVSLAAALVLAGVFAGSATPAGAKLVLGAFPPEQRGLPMGIRQSAVPAGTLIAALVLPLIATQLSVHWALAVGGVAPLAGSLGVYLLARRLADPTAVRADPVGRRLPLRTLARDRNVVLATAWGVVFVGGQYALVSYLILDLTSESHRGLGFAALMLALASAGGVVGRVAWGILSDRVWRGRRKPPLLALTLAGTVSAVALAVLPAAPVGVLVVAASAMAGLTMLSWQGVWMSLMSEISPHDSAGTTVGFGLTFVNLAIVGWPPVFGLLAELGGGFRLPWAALAVAFAGSALLLPGMTEPRDRERAIGSIQAKSRTQL